MLNMETTVATISTAVTVASAVANLIPPSDNKIIEAIRWFINKLALNFRVQK